MPIAVAGLAAADGYVLLDRTAPLLGIAVCDCAWAGAAGIRRRGAAGTAGRLRFTASIGRFARVASGAGRGVIASRAVAAVLTGHGNASLYAVPGDHALKKNPEAVAAAAMDWLATL